MPPTIWPSPSPTPRSQDGTEAPRWTARHAGELRLAFQPKVRVADGEVESLEVLVRWAHPDLGLLMPGRFLPAIAGRPAMADLSRWVADSAVGQMARWRASGLSVAVALNADDSWIGGEAAADPVLDALDRWGEDPADLVVEVADRSIDPRDSAVGPAGLPPSLAVLTAAGVGLALDDFGRGAGSLSRLADWPVTELKIPLPDPADDGETASRSAGLFTAESTRPSRRAALVAAVVGLGQSVGASVVAQGIENVAQLKTAVDAGCPVVQGFLLAAPVAPADLPGLIASRPWTRRLGLPTAA